MSMQYLKSSMETAKNPQVVNEVNSQVDKNHCACCGLSNGELSRCSRCKKAYYCGVDCQKKHFPQHKKTCKPQNTTQSTQSIPASEPIKQNTKSGIDEFKELKFVGKGNFSEIYSAVSLKDGKKYAIKQIDKAKLKRLEKEADVLMEKHCLQKLKGWDYAVQIQKTFQDQLSLYIQMEYPEKGELWNQCRTFGFMAESMVKYYFLNIVKAIFELHNKFEIIHRDLKPENVLVTTNNHIKLIDFGTAKDLSRPDLKGSGNGSRRRKVFEHYVGTPNYMAPQCIHNKASQKVSDIYSLAGLFYFLKSGNTPFTGGSEYLIFKKSLDNIVYLPYEVFNKVEQDLILKMMDKDWSSRINIDGVMSHQYFKGVDFNKLPTYQESVAQITQVQSSLIKIKQEVLRYADKSDAPLQQRLTLYKNTIKPQLEKAISQTKQSISTTKEFRNGVRLLKIGIVNMLYLLDDTNLGFEELHKKYCDSDDLQF